jgi:acetyl esterase/lipase
MSRSLPRPAVLLLLALLALAGVLGLPTTQARAGLPILTPKAPPAPVIAPVQAPISADPAGPVRGTMILVHGGGWAGHDGVRQNDLLTRPGDLLVARGWRVVSIDYNEGAAGLQDVLDTAGAELARRSSDGPLCIYGESAGAHLALMAASRLSAIDCVIGLGAPTDLYQYTVEAAASSDDRVKLVASQIARLFGTTPEATSPWNVVTLAPALHADVLLVHETDDEIVTASHAQRFQAARPSTQLVELAAGDQADPLTRFMHGTVSDGGRGQYMAGVGSFADRAVAGRVADRRASRSGCSQVTRSVAQTGPKGLQSALRCLTRTAARRAPSGSARWRETSVKLRGEINAARVWASLRATKNGQRALAAVARRGAKVTVRTGDQSRVTLRATRTR